jgi:HD-GYP domain-containing protein (c-di-GMP phosphodiesterase class II)/putative methionine-R-sulfoxide reductase with GAF domain
MAKKKDQDYGEVFIKLANQLDLTDTRPERVYTTILRNVARTLEVEQVSIWQFARASMEVHCIAVHGRTEMQPPETRIDLSSYASYLFSLQTEISLSTSNVKKDERFTDLPEKYWITPNIKSGLHIPVRVTNKVPCILRVDSRTRRTWTPEEVQFCCQVANLVSQIILSSQLETINQHTDTLKNLSMGLVHQFNPSTLLNDLVRKCVETLGGTEGMLYLTDPERKRIIGTAGYKVPDKFFGQIIRYGENVAGKVAETGKDLLIKDYRTWSGRSREVGKKEPPTSILSMPILSHTDIVGVLQLTRQDGVQPFLEDDRKVLTQFATLASLAFEKNRLSEGANRLKRIHETLLQLFQTTSLTSSVEDCLESTADYVIHAIDVPAAIIHINGLVSVRGLPPEADRQIEDELRKRGKQFDLTVTVSDVDTGDKGYPELAEVMKRLRVKSYILKPIRINRDRTGFVCVASRFPRSWTLEEARMVEVAGRQVGMTIAGIELNQESHAHAEMIRRLTSATSTLNHIVSLDEMIQLIGQGAVRLSNADRLAMILREQDGVIRASWVFGLARSDFTRVIEKEGTQILAMFSESGLPMMISNVADSPLPQGLKKHLSGERVNSARITPIIHSRNVIGVIAALDEGSVDWPSWEREVMVTFANNASLSLQTIWLYEQLEKGYLDLALSLANTVDARESQIRSTKLAEWSQHTAQLLGLSDEDQSLVRWAALLHDIGKAEIPDEVLRKPGLLNAAERKVIEQYPIKSEKLLSSSSRYQRVGKILRHINERFDGKGYPDKKKGEDIPLPARILAVANAYGSMIDNRPYRQACTHEDAVQEIMKNSGTQFDPAVVNAFLQTVSRSETVH